MLRQITNEKKSYFTPNLFRGKTKTRDLLPANLVKSSLEDGKDDRMGGIYRNCMSDVYSF